ncbi:hypothetical protein Nepgr_018284 [Nepenthes gracilis]|uniref:RING-type E3 ubiquitin transferase n=1 Tax=Nepenthes gracilis TaxID=150966 RepID=A0AAD3SR11_NEPGR|nr:hypothetical protein Nepgr_018284 [Nepenthes gracilis]
MVKATATKSSPWALVSLIALLFDFGISRPIPLPVFTEVGVDVLGGGEGSPNLSPPPPPNAIIGEVAASSSSLEPPPPPPAAASPPFSPTLPQKNSYSPFKPSIAVIVALLTTMFSVTFLLLLYAKHCRRGNGVVGYLGDGANNTRGATPVSARKNSGIDWSVIESLPVFRFSSLTGQRHGLECAVCLNRFDPIEVLRMLPKCKHAFHVECVDTWLDAHSTCPLCRYRVDPEDVLLVETNQPAGLETEGREDTASSESSQKSLAKAARRVPGRHTYAGERSGAAIKTPGLRRSYDGSQLATKRASVGVGCFDRHRKDGLLMTADRTCSGFERRLDHRIIISGKPEEAGRERWSDLQPSDLLYLRWESVMNEGRRSSASKGGQAGQRRSHHRDRAQRNSGIHEARWDGRNVDGLDFSIKASCTVENVSRRGIQYQTNTALPNKRGAEPFG